MRDYYLLINNQQVGPYTADQLHQMLAQGQLQAESSAWYDGLPDWAPVSLILEHARVHPTPVAPALVVAAAAPPPGVPHQALPVSAGVVQTNVKQGALVGSLVCLVLGLLLMYFTLFSFILYGPLFLVAFILSIRRNGPRPGGGRHPAAFGHAGNPDHHGPGSFHSSRK